jgi:hypothetical protein
VGREQDVPFHLAPEELHKVAARIVVRYAARLLKVEVAAIEDDGAVADSPVNSVAECLGAGARPALADEDRLAEQIRHALGV